MSKPKPKQPVRNDLWRFTPPAESKDRRTVRIDLMQYGLMCQMYDLAKVPKLPGDGR